MDKCNFKVLAVINSELTEQQKGETMKKIKLLQSKLSIIETDNDIYCNIQEDNQEFGSVVFFFLELKKIKECFSHLVYYDYLDNEEEIAV